MPVNRSGYTWLDVNGRSKMTMPRTLSLPSTSLQTAMLTFSNAQLLSVFEGPESTYAVLPVAAPFQSVTDVALLYFSTVSGDIVSLTLPAPDASIFKADTVTVDPTMVASLITACIGYLTDASGNVVTSFINGVRAVRS